MVLLDYKKPSILRNMLLTFVGAGLAMGVVFPVFASIFVTYKPGMLLWFVIACILAGISIGFFNYWLLKKMLLTRLMRIGEVANAISKNDISHTCTMESHDFIGEMAQSFNRMGENLRFMVNRIAHMTEELKTASSGMLDVSQNTHQSVTTQKSRTEKITESINTMNANAIAMSESTLSASNAAKEAENATANGTEIVQSTIHTIHSLAEEVEKTAGVIQNLKQDTQNISTVLSVIKDISEQTNLLALNAAIEAARAGEHGRGFAVVADEVRGLAAKTQESAIQIESMVSQFQSVAGKAVKVMKNGQDKAYEGVDHANQAGEALLSIAQAVKTITEMNLQIEQAAQSQKSHNEVVLHNMQDIHEVGGNVTQGADHTAHACQNVSAHAEELHKLISQFKTH